MKRRDRIATSIMASLALAFVLVIWTMGPMIGPLLGIQRTPDEIVEWITRHNIVVLMNPTPVIKERNGSYHDWAFAEFETRHKTGVALWIEGSGILGLWAARRKLMKDTDNKASQPIAGKPGSG